MKVWIKYKDGKVECSKDCVYTEEDLIGLRIGLSYIGAKIIKVESEDLI